MALQKLQKREGWLAELLIGMSAPFQRVFSFPLSPLENRTFISAVICMLKMRRECRMHSMRRRSQQNPVQRLMTKHLFKFWTVSECLILPTVLIPLFLSGMSSFQALVEIFPQCQMQEGRFRAGFCVQASVEGVAWRIWLQPGPHFNARLQIRDASPLEHPPSAMRALSTFSGEHLGKCVCHNSCACECQDVGLQLVSSQQSHKLHYPRVRSRCNASGFKQTVE